MRQTGVSMLINSEKEFNAIRDFLTEDVLYLKWHEVFTTRPTAVVLKANKNSGFSSGSLGCAVYQKESGIKVVPFSDNIVQYLL